MFIFFLCLKVRDEFNSTKLPLCIARPSIVTPALKEPMPGEYTIFSSLREIIKHSTESILGWVDSLNGPIGIMVAGAKGVMRSMLCEAEFHAEVIAVDIAINGLLIIAQKIGTLKQR